MDYGTDVFYARLAERAIAGWRDWNASFGETLYHETGFLVLSAAPMHFASGSGT